jgi:hypothetical protein
VDLALFGTNQHIQRTQQHEARVGHSPFESPPGQRQTSHYEFLRAWRLQVARIRCSRRITPRSSVQCYVPTFLTPQAERNRGERHRWFGANSWGVCWREAVP